MNPRKIGVLVMSYGTPESMDQIEAYYTHIRRGNPPSPEQLDNLKKRYEAIVGGFFPLRENTDRQVRTLEETLNRRYADQGQRRFVCYQGLKHARPFIEDGVEQMAADGVDQAVGIVLAPHYSVMSVGSYIKRAREAAEKHGLPMNFVESYHLHPQLVEALTLKVSDAMNRFSPQEREQVRVIFSAHSLPESILEMGDPYPRQLLETSEAVAKRAGVADWQFAWQSAGRTSVPWLGPDILDVLRRIRSEEQVRCVLMCPLGFVSDHLEVLYDIDIECRQLAGQLDMHLERTASLNTDEKFMECLAERVYSHMKTE